MEFPHLHLHTTHSHLDGFGTVENFYKQAAKEGRAALGHTEHGNISSWPSAQLCGDKYGVKPVFGIEAYIVKDNRDRKRGSNHVTLLAKNQTGMTNLFEMVSDSFNKGFFYKPRMSWRRLAQRSEGIIAFSGCWSGYATQHLIGRVVKNPTFDIKGEVPELEDVKRWLKFMKKTFGADFYMEMMPVYSPMQVEVLAELCELARKFGIPVVATNDCHYIHDGDHDPQDDLVCINTLSKKSDTDRMKYDVTDLYLKTEEQMKDSFKEVEAPDWLAKKAIENAYKVAEECKSRVPLAEPVRYDSRSAFVPKPDDISDDKEGRKRYFKKVIKYMWGERDFIPRTKAYRERALYEIGIFADKDYIDYMLIIWDVVWAAKTRSPDEGGPMFVGPARGSSSGSLICYVLGITEIDPFDDNLIFERFVAPNRTDPPDIDIDFPDDDRAWIQEYLTKRWGGEKHVGNLISHAIFKGKIALTDIGRIYSVPIWAVEKVKSLLLERSSGDARASFTIEDTFKEFPEAKQIVEKYPQLRLAGRLEGQIRHEGKHAAGIVVSTGAPLEATGGFYRDGRFWMDKRDAEKFGYLKIDSLGLNTLRILRESAYNIGIRGQKLLDFFYRMKMDDPDVIGAFSRCDVEGVFQFDGQAQMAVTRQLKPETYTEVRDLTALSRPGPLHCGGFERYRRRARQEETEWSTPDEISHVVGDTFGVMIYQEQVMEVMKDLGRMTWEEIVDVRRHISKSVGVEHFEVFHKSFNKGAIGHYGLDEGIAQEIWDQMCTFGSWAFNKAHAAAYTRLSIWCMYMKVKHPKAFLAAMAGHCSSEDKRARSIRAFQRQLGRILPVDVNRCKKQFSLEKGDLRPGLSDIKGVGVKAADEICAAQPFASFTDFLERVPKRVVNKRVRKVLHAVGAFRTWTQDQDCIDDRKLCEVDEYKSGFATKREFVSSHFFWVLPVNFPSIRRQLRVKPLEAIEERDYTQNGIKVVGRVRKVNQRDLKELGSEEQRAKLKPGEETRFINITIEDDTDFTMVTVPRRMYRKMKNTVFNDLPEGATLYGEGAVLEGGRRVFLEKLAAVIGE